MLSSPDIHHKVAISFLAWWQEAGVDYVCDSDAMNWLESPVADDRPIPPAAVFLAKQPMAAPQVTAARPPDIEPTDWPSDITSLKAAIAEGAALPGCGYGSRCVPPSGEAGAAAFIIVDCPEEEEVVAGHFGEGEVAALLKNMLLAAKILPDFTYHAALAHSRSAANSIPKNDLPTLAAFIRYQIALVKPQVVILFGAAVCEALLGQDVMQARGNLLYINQDDRKTAAIATFHPRTLIAQPRMKAKAWQDLQMLARKDYL